jgi:hypothetical protein
MARHRLSFWATTAASAAIALALTALMVAIIEWGLGQSGKAPYWVTYLEVGFAELLIMPLTAASGLVAAGGLVALRRDALEAQGMPYARSTPREATVFPIAVMRAVLGRQRFGLCPGDFVEIRCLDEILHTLDDNGTLDGVPFMPEMAAYCGTRARVLRRVDKLNDWIYGAGLMRMHRLVLLTGLRCDGSAHGGCQSNCHLRWREEWLRPVAHAGSSNKFTARTPAEESQLAALSAFASRPSDTGAGPRYVCQATELTAGGVPLLMADLRHYGRDLMTGNVRLMPLCTGLAIAFFNRVQNRRGEPAFPYYSFGTAKAPAHEALDLQPGDHVRVKQKKFIEPTLNSQSRNRGLYFDRDMLRFCGGEYRIKARVERVMIEKTGELRQISNTCLILDGVMSTGEYQGFNPENEFVFWREVWLERVAPSDVP